MTKIQKPGIEAEAQFWAQGWIHVAGIDEAGRGAWAGPVYAGAVVLPPQMEILDMLAGVRDSKTLSARQREQLYQRIQEVALAVGIGWATAREIDIQGIVPATRLAMHRALDTLTVSPQALVIDALSLPDTPLPQQAFPYADALSLSVAAAGIVAKVNRDRWLITEADLSYPGYGFATHKGYGTRQHQTALDTLGICPLHRRSFRPVKARLK
ncbi:MAG: ribonuclease HII [Anaerolineae bacterium]|nr:ribonuclease HII [Anaerolineae bacterium]